MQARPAQPLNTDRAIVMAFGGITALSSRIGVNRSVVFGWTKSGIPPARWVDLVELAEREGIAGVDYPTLARVRKARDLAQMEIDRINARRRQRRHLSMHVVT